MLCHIYLSLKFPEYDNLFFSDCPLFSQLAIRLIGEAIILHPRVGPLSNTGRQCRFQWLTASTQHHANFWC